LQRGAYIKGKNAIHLACVYEERNRIFALQSFWAREPFISTAGRDESVVRTYIQPRSQWTRAARVKVVATDFGGAKS
jgi:hypothetical protein